MFYLTLSSKFGSWSATWYCSSWHIHVMINRQLSKQGIRWPVSPDCIAGSDIDPSRLSIFEVIRCQVTSFQIIVWNMLRLCHYGPALLRFWFQTDLGRDNSATYLRIQAGKTSSYHGHTLVTLYVQFLYSDWSKFDRWVHAENLCSILNLVYFDSWSWQSFVSICDVFNCLFPLDVQNEIQLLSRVFCYSWLVCLLGFWLRNASLIKIR